MIRLAELIRHFEADFYTQYGQYLLPSHAQALEAMKTCRNEDSLQLEVRCSDCDQSAYYPHSCGHRLCPHCQHHESSQWLQRQRQKLLPVDYFMITFTLPAQLRALAWDHQRIVYGLMFECVWQTLSTFSQNDKTLQGMPGVTAMLHTHARAINYHPHLHTIVPAGAIDTKHRLWHEKGGRYLFNEQALAKVFRAKLLDALTAAGLTLPPALPAQWVVDCRRVGTGEPALCYLGKYLYRGVIQEKDIIEYTDAQVTYRYKPSKTGRYQAKTVSGAEFLWLLLQHTLPKGFRRVRDYGFLHPNSKSLIRLLQYLFRRPAPPPPNRQNKAAIRCRRCGAPTVIVRTQICPDSASDLAPAPPPL